VATQRDDDDNGYRQLIGDVVLRRRNRLNLSQGQLAERLGQHRQYVGRLEHGGDVSLTLDAIAKIAAQLEMPATELLQPFLEQDAKWNGLIVTALVTDPKLHQLRRLAHRLTTAADRLSLTELRSVAQYAETMAKQRSDASR
jgi:transcriptional regulator with XRE-family HTH domain